MQKLSLKVLLRFLSVYSHWNLVRRSEGYHLYFITKDSECSAVLPFPERRGGRHLANHRSRRRKRKPNVPLVRRTKMRSKTPPEADGQCNIGSATNGHNSGKDVFIFSPIFETVEEAVQVGVGPVENSLLNHQKRTTSFRSSFDSLAWDDFLPLKGDNSGSDDDDSYSTLENSTIFDSKESTPFLAEEMQSDFGLKEMKKSSKDPYNKIVRHEADKLLKDMLQLRKEIEEMNYSVNTQPESVEARQPSESAPQDESCLMDRLESMTAEVRKEMIEEELKKKQLLTCKRMNMDDDTKIRNFFNSIVQKKDSASTTKTNTPEELISPTSTIIPSTATTPDSTNPPPQPTTAEFSIPTTNAVGSKENSVSREMSENPPKSPRKGSPKLQGVGRGLAQPVLQQLNFDLKEEVKVKPDDSIVISAMASPAKKRAADRKKKSEKAVRPTFSTDSLKRKSKKKKEDGNVELPFCGYNSYTSSQKTAQHFFNSLDRRKSKKKKELQTVLTAEEKLKAKEMLASLLAIREKKGAKDNKVLESLISVIALSSTNLSLPTAPTSNAVQFKDLFDFEANFSESRNVFEKLAMGGSSEQHTLQDLFPWSDKEGGNLNKLKY